jgi:tRNA/tmRNA/rRNA uracil-C5-methylase (TrmA/RlmC/RlmD family)
MCDIFAAPVTISNRQIATNKLCGPGVITTNCSITNNVSVHSHNIKDGDMQLAVGVPSLRETVAGLELQLPPVKNLWNTIHGAEMLCQALEELLAPSKKTTVLDIGCGIGLLGLYLSKVCIACSICLFVSFFLLK